MAGLRVCVLAALLSLSTGAVHHLRTDTLEHVHHTDPVVAHNASDVVLPAALASLAKGCQCHFKGHCVCGAAQEFMQCISDHCASGMCDCGKNEYKKACLSFGDTCSHSLTMDCSTTKFTCTECYQEGCDKKKEKKEKKLQMKKERAEKKAKLKIKNEEKLKEKATKLGKFALKKGAAKKAPEPAKPTKALKKTEDDYEPVNRWWEREDGAESGKRGAKKWDTFEHHGLVYAPEFVADNIPPLIYDGKKIELSADAAEIAFFWVSVRGSDYETKPIFVNNFWKVFQKVLPQDTPIKEFSKCNFDLIWEHREQERQKRLDRPKEEKEAEKEKNAAETEYYQYALLNGIREKLGAIRLEPPQLFRGRGEHPKQGMLKKRTFPESVIINIGAEACVPRPYGVPGHAYKDVVHENTVQWIAGFDDGVTGEMKYVSFAATSGLKGQPDMLKYDRARRLLKVVQKIRDSYQKMWHAKEKIDRQKAVATYFIDRLALRVGGEKDTEEEADTVGCCSLRVEHVKLEPPNLVHFDFLGKDSIRYLNTVQVHETVYALLQQFRAGKADTDQIFDEVAPGILNEYFKEFMDDLSAKVFRTYNASYTLQSELSKFPMENLKLYNQDDLVKYYNDANRQVAILCNHQRAESKTHTASMEKLKAAQTIMEKNIKALKKHMQRLENPGAKKEMSQDQASKFPKDVEGCKKKIAQFKLRLEKHVKNMELKEENKTVALGTSKTNYMDPRITVSWCKKVGLAIERVFPRTLRTKFPWAMHFKSTYQFD
eukprot:gnl/TRDRNA2_/TRDRNA2_84451_c0_seq4.p1 gnl/TRDRNA2_/TRDRNA2_84451_c0~~gnl/TRDRNA2_/TRDRNA2_84451_c0_seq4.p1  ORF type:complete len:771 (+),score=215.04 gnl/TRDRNA2_/TRDRNA2_84451_c0_seq4:66-2378(+)